MAEYEGSPPGPNRRAVLAGALGLAVGAGAGAAVGFTFRDQDGRTTASAPTADLVDATGAYQAGIDRPATPQRHGLVLSIDLAGTDLTFLPALGEAIVTLTGNGDRDVLPDGPFGLTITVGLGPRLVAAHHPGMPGGEELPLFAGDQDIPEAGRGGDLLLALYGNDPGSLHPVATHLLAGLPGATVRWSQRGFRGPGTGMEVRNPLGFQDGVIVPHGDAELAENVWQADGGTICVIRRLQLKTDLFRGRPVAEQEAVIGRRRADGTPLSGGGPTDQVNLGLKSADGNYLVPARAHARAAHPSFTGSKLMLRRGYAFDNGGQDSGLMFICFQQDLRTFVATQQRLDEVDDLMQYVTATASATFLILPGFSVDGPLGSTLAGR